MKAFLNGAPTTLDRLRVGTQAVVTDVSSQQHDQPGNHIEIARRLKELGFVSGETVQILHKGYFGGEPVAVRVGQSTFALRHFEAALIGVALPGSC
ncbi:FeoA family protein [Undibacterium rugosum]|uniref:Ferrous iron transport protein A n=1 Tax=Undibacterium rugosum TaxID=2762291 RepID=A0A923I4C2_9BURK|nr:FeoA family protein [Undibacterium rugosum]MBC3935829.1 ferrous iron transport protein A [Undibacterium rugosum]MBR7779389.1 ferrous iron transport protein A [Undibacterium rugosum]